MKKSEYTTYSGGVRYYDSEKEGKEAVEDAERLDAAIAEGRPAGEVMKILREVSGRLPAVLARSIRFGRLFYNDFLAEAGKYAKQFFGANSSALPKAYRHFLKNKDADWTSDALRRLVSDLSCPAKVAPVVAEYKWLAGRLLQDDVYLSCSDEGKEFLLGVAKKAEPIVRRTFVAQIMAEGQANRKERVRVYRSLRPDREYTVRERKEAIQTSAYLMGHHVKVNAAHNGLTQPYSNNAYLPDYHLAVCSKVQEAYAESGYVRYQWARNKLPGYETIRCSFPQFASMSDNYSQSTDRTVMERICSGDNPGNLVLACDLEGVRFGLKQIIYLMKNRKLNILKFILGEAPDLLRTLDLSKMLFYVSAYGDWKMAAEAAAAIESAAPGTAASAIDHFGNTPIWYTLYDLETTHQYDTVRNPVAARENGEAARKEYVDLLESFGCDRYCKNHLGVSYADIEGR